MSGFVAFIGDRLGTFIGKKRLSIFGTRPRRTGQIIGVLAGVAIMLLTIIVLAVVNRGAVKTILDAQEAAAEIGRLTVERNALTANLNNLNKRIRTQQAELLQAGNEVATAQGLLDIAIDEKNTVEAERKQLADDINALKARLSSLESQATIVSQANKELKAQNESLKLDNSGLLSEKQALEEQKQRLDNISINLKAQVEVTNSQLLNVESQVTSLEKKLAAQAYELTILQAERRSANEAGISYRENEIVYSGLISSQNRNEIRSQLSNLLTEANSAALERGAGEIEVKSSQFDALVNDILKTAKDDIVTLRSPQDYFGVSKIEVEVENFENTNILKKGSLLLSKKIFLDENISTESSLRADIAGLVNEAKTQLVLKGLAVKPIIENLDSEGFAKQLLRMKGPLTIALLAEDNILASGPAKMKLIILY